MAWLPGLPLRLSAREKYMEGGGRGIPVRSELGGATGCAITTAAGLTEMALPVAADPAACTGRKRTPWRTCLVFWDGEGEAGSVAATRG